jgi:hypothetical protein
MRVWQFKAIHGDQFAKVTPPPRSFPKKDAFGASMRLPEDDLTTSTNTEHIETREGENGKSLSSSPD